MLKCIVQIFITVRCQLGPYYFVSSPLLSLWEARDTCEPTVSKTNKKIKVWKVIVVQDQFISNEYRLQKRDPSKSISCSDSDQFSTINTEYLCKQMCVLLV